MGLFRNVLSVCFVVGSLSLFAALPMSDDLQGGVPCDAYVLPGFTGGCTAVVL